jgi:hypothetical protein
MRGKRSAPLAPRERLSLFRKRASEMEDLRLIRSGMKMQFRLTFDSDSRTLHYEANEPDEEDIRSFLLLFRRFISQSEPIFINRIFDDCLRLLSDDVLKSEVKMARDSWKKRTSSGPVKMLCDGNPISPEYMLDLWINGHYFHDDAKKASELEGLLSRPGSPARMQFLVDLSALASLILSTADVVTQALDENLFQFPTDME